MEASFVDNMLYHDSPAHPLSNSRLEFVTCPEANKEIDPGIDPQLLVTPRSSERGDFPIPLYRTYLREEGSHQ